MTMFRYSALRCALFVTFLVMVSTLAAHQLLL